MVNKEKPVSVGCNSENRQGNKNHAPGPFPGHKSIICRSKSKSLPEGQEVVKGWLTGRDS